MNLDLRCPPKGGLPTPAAAKMAPEVLIRPIVPADATLLGEFVRSL